MTFLNIVLAYLQIHCIGSTHPGLTMKYLMQMMQHLIMRGFLKGYFLSLDFLIKYLVQIMLILESVFICAVFIQVIHQFFLKPSADDSSADSIALRDTLWTCDLEFCCYMYFMNQFLPC